METTVRRNSTPRKLVAILLIAAGIAAVGFMFVLPNADNPTNMLGNSRSAANRVSIDDIDHSLLDDLLAKYVDEDGLVNYSAWKSSAADRRALLRYFDELSRADTEKPARREAKLAFWINAYNAVTLEGILRAYPTTSIRNHTSKLGGYNVWHDLQLRVGAASHSLDQMEHQILRKMGEPRIHFAIVCASIGCPRLLNRAYTADELEEQLELNTRDFFSRSNNARVDRDENVVYLSSILDWFGEDFGNTQQERLQFLLPYLPDDIAAVAQKPNVTIEYLDYNWDLNAQSATH